MTESGAGLRGPTRRSSGDRSGILRAWPQAAWLAWALTGAPLSPAAAQAPAAAPPSTASAGALPLRAAPSPPPGPSVALSGRFGQRALLVIDGRPRTVAVGETVDGVRLLGWRDDQADVAVGTQRLSLRVGAAPVDLGQGRVAGNAQETTGRVVLQADDGGHFMGAGSINGRATRFMVDTGATLISLSQAEADRLGIPFREGARAMANTANGEVPVHRVMLQSVRVGNVEVPMLEAVVMPAAMPHVLLGNNFLERFSLQREGRTMTLQRRP